MKTKTFRKHSSSKNNNKNSNNGIINGKFCPRTTGNAVLVVLLITFIFAFVNIYNGSNIISFDEEALSSYLELGTILQMRKKTSATNTSTRSRTFHVIHCLSGNDTYFIDEWEAGLKSILVNSPLDSNLHVHLIADSNAASAIDEKIMSSKLTESFWRNEISVIVHNIEEMLPSWRTFLTESLTNESNRDWMDYRVGIGGYLRLLAHRVVVPYECENQNNVDGAHHTCGDFEKRDLEEALYMDTDVVIIGNLNHLMFTTGKVLQKAKKEGKGRPLWIWNRNSGFMVIDLLKFERLWELAATIPSMIRDDEAKMKGDQWLLGKVEDNFPNEHVTATMPDEWNTHVGHGFRRFPQKLYTARERGTGMLHFTAPTHFGKNFMDLGGTDKWCKFSPSCNHTAVGAGGDMDKVRRSWGLAEYYVKLSWDWAIFQGGASKLRPGEDGYMLKYIKRICHPEGHNLLSSDK